MKRGREDKGRGMGGGRREGDGGKDRRRERGRRVEGEEGERINHIQSSVVVMVTSLQSRLMEVLPIVRLDTRTL